MEYEHRRETESWLDFNVGIPGAKTISPGAALKYLPTKVN